jgi:predicted membrane protein
MADHSMDTGPRADDGRASMSRLTGRLVWGIIFLGLGAAWTLDNLGLVDSDAIVRWWPLLLVAFGLAKLTGLGARRSVFAGTLYLVAGGWLTLYAMGLVRNGIGGLWPLALIVIGGRFVMHAMGKPAPLLVHGHGHRKETIDPEGRVKMDVAMATVQSRVRPGDFRGGVINAVMGSVELDLRDAVLGPERNELETNGVMAGLVIIVPRGWRVVSEVSCFMASVEDHTEKTSAATPGGALVLRGTALMAGIEIKH